MWVSNLIWAQLGGSSDFGWAHISVCGPLLCRLWAGWSKIASARTAYLCSMCLLILQQASLSLFTCQPMRQGSRRAELKLARALEAWTWNWHNLTSTIFCSSKQVDECILVYFSAAGRQFGPCALLRRVIYMPCFSCHLSTPHPTPVGRPALLASSSLVLLRFRFCLHKTFWNDFRLN